MIKVGLINYGLGNIKSMIGAITFMGFEYVFSSDFDELDSCDIIILPGVGAFPKGMKNLKRNKMDKYLLNNIKKRPLFGICLGMQLLFTKGTEFKNIKGLGLIEGKVNKLSNQKGLRIPNIGWDRIINHSFNNLENNSFYFVHSYSVKPDDNSVITSESVYGEESFVSSIQKENIYGFQFHPEKSGYAGVSFLRNIIIESLENYG